MALAEIAADLLREGNYSATRDMLRRVASTLEALSSYGSQPGAPVAGRLTDDVEPPGFGAVAGLLPGSKQGLASNKQLQKRPARAVSATRVPRRAHQRGTASQREERKRKDLLAAAKAAVREAERTLNVARTQVKRFAAKLDTALLRKEAIERQRALMEQRLAVTSKDAEEARDHAKDAAANSSEATKTAEAAERALQSARRQLQRIAGD